MRVCRGWRARREEWTAAVSRLFDQIHSWLAESDPKHVLDVVRVETEKAEPGLGVYSIQTLKIPNKRTPFRLVLTIRHAIPPHMAVASDPRTLGAQVNFRFVPAA